MINNLSQIVSSKQTAQSVFLRLVSPMTRGFFRDESWVGPNQLFRSIRALGGEVEISSTAYYYRADSLETAGKRWNLMVTANGFTFPALLTADFGASQVGKTDIYDLCITV